MQYVWRARMCNLRACNELLDVKCLVGGCSAYIAEVAGGEKKAGCVHFLFFWSVFSVRVICAYTTLSLCVWLCWPCDGGVNLFNAYIFA